MAVRKMPWNIHGSSSKPFLSKSSGALVPHHKFYSILSASSLNHAIIDVRIVVLNHPTCEYACWCRDHGLILLFAVQQIHAGLQLSSTTSSRLQKVSWFSFFFLELAHLS